MPITSFPALYLSISPKIFLINVSPKNITHNPLTIPNTSHLFLFISTSDRFNILKNKFTYFRFFSTQNKGIAQSSNPMILRHLLFIYLILSAGILRIQSSVSQDPSPHFIPYMNLYIIVRPVIDKQRRLSSDHNRSHKYAGYGPGEQQIPENEYDREVHDIKDHIF